jgi:transcriptional regulator with XRE-family HTH domain
MNEIPINDVIRNNIKSLRKKLGWSQELLAEKTGVSAPYITQIEVGKRTPSLEIVEKLALAFGVKYKILFDSDFADGNEADFNDFSKHVLESKVISAVCTAIKTEFQS